MKTAQAVLDIAQVDPEVVGITFDRAPRLGYATTGELMAELMARAINQNRTAAISALDGVYAHLDGAALAYRPADR